ncbi:MAG: hypothetical protein WA982_07355 [Rubrobacteraceae bacterium]
MTETTLQRQVGESVCGADAGLPTGEEHQELGRLLQEAARLLEGADLQGANETLKVAEQVLTVRRGIFDLGLR